MIGVEFFGCETDEDRAACCASFLAAHFGVTVKELATVLQMLHFAPSKREDAANSKQAADIGG